MTDSAQVDAAADEGAVGGGGMGAPAPRPCDSCPYRRDVPSGVWHAEEYEKLRLYDLDMALQPQKLFQCHQTDAGNEMRRMCAGWVGCHGPDLLGLRLALLSGRISEAVFEAAAEYRSPVPLFGSGSEAADHGQAEIDCPGTDAAHVIDKISRRRSDLARTASVNRPSRGRICCGAAAAAA
ncbi:DUF6283 family protein [Nocardia sp. CDC160]|uniref:DUF6283 family protein n=1 Tax=Nocardia sp. CDC160 TaxID=3112166 RepID=UPI002DB63F5E|nr:DUF6283 family protein [Nocardia sp. CDC160]MEC3919197.1 DUF6283 family protein [Nocardia sp. CDC160]